MGWVKISDDFYDHPKFDRLTALGDATWVRGLAHANRNLSDGYIGARKALQLVDTTGLDASPQQGIDELLRAGLWLEVEGGYQVHDYLDYQLSKVTIQGKAQANRERVAAYTERKKDAAAQKINNVPMAVQEPVNNVPMAMQQEGAEARKDAEVAPETNAVANALANAPANAPLHHTPTPTPTPLSTSLCSGAALEPETAKKPRALYSADFEQFWLAYPRKHSKGDAWKAWEVWRKRGQLPSLDVLAVAAASYARSRKGEDPQFTKLPAGWLRDRKWEDQDGTTSTGAAAPLDVEAQKRRSSMEAWLAARGSSLAEYDARKSESGWLASLEEGPK